MMRNAPVAASSPSVRSSVKPAIATKRKPKSKTAQSTNVLLVKHPVGKGRQSTYSLPGEEHAYGVPPKQHQETAGRVMAHWATNQQSKTAVPSLDFAAMNKASIKAGISRSGAQYQFRKTTPTHVKLVDGSKSQLGHDDIGKSSSVGVITSRKLPSDSDQNFTYGLPTRPSSPIARCMTDYYQRQYEEDLEYREVVKAAALKKKQPQLARDPTQPLQHKPVRKETIFQRDPKTLFKMQRFQNAEGRVNCHRTEDDVQIRRPPATSGTAAQ